MPLSRQAAGFEPGFSQRWNHKTVRWSAFPPDLQISETESQEFFVSYQVTNIIANCAIANWPRSHATGQ
jgi:hypothetical protein